MKKPELTNVDWLGPKDEMDRASHRFGRCSECQEIICVEKAVTDTLDIQSQTTEMLYKAFRTHVELNHSEELAKPCAHRKRAKRPVLFLRNVASTRACVRGFPGVATVGTT